MVKLARFIFQVSFIVCFLASCAATNKSNESDMNANQTPSKHLIMFSSTEVDRRLTRGATTQSQVAMWFGQPTGVSESGELTYWHYLDHRRAEPQNGEPSGIATLNVVFDAQQILIDYDFQSRLFNE